MRGDLRLCIKTCGHLLITRMIMTGLTRVTRETLAVLYPAALQEYQDLLRETNGPETEFEPPTGFQDLVLDDIERYQERRAQRTELSRVLGVGR